MFDELKDPRPPQVTDLHIVSVIARAHRIRRRQRVAMLTTTAAFAGAIGGLAFMSRGSSPSPSIEFASGPSTDAASITPLVFASTVPLPVTTLSRPDDGEAPALTEPAVAATEAGSDPASDDPSFTYRSTDPVSNVATTVPVNAAAPSTTIEAVAQPTTAIPGQFVAVAATGDLVRVDTSSGATTILVPATRADPGSAGGTLTATLTAGGITPDGLSAYYSDSTSGLGMVHAVTIANPEPAPPAWGPGTDPKLSPNGERWIVRNSDSTISVQSKSEANQTLGTLPSSTVVDYAWYGDDGIALLEHDGKVWTVRILDNTLTKSIENPSTVDDEYLAGGPDAVSVRFVGRTINGVLLTAQRRELDPAGPITLHLWVRPGPGSEDRWSSLLVSYTTITVDRNGEWLLRLAADGTLTTDAVGGHLERKVAGTYKSAAW